MEARLLHIFRNTPLGRETLLQSIYFCKQMAVTPIVSAAASRRLS